MSTITKDDYERIREPCKSCDSGLSATGRGMDKKFYCGQNGAKLMGGGSLDWYRITDCPKRN